MGDGSLLDNQLPLQPRSSLHSGLHIVLEHTNTHKPPETKPPGPFRLAQGLVNDLAPTEQHRGESAAPRSEVNDPWFWGTYPTPLSCHRW